MYIVYKHWLCTEVFLFSSKGFCGEVIFYYASNQTNMFNRVTVASDGGKLDFYFVETTLSSFEPHGEHQILFVELNISAFSKRYGQIGNHWVPFKCTENTFRAYPAPA